MRLHNAPRRHWYTCGHSIGLIRLAQPVDKLENSRLHNDQKLTRRLRLKLRTTESSVERICLETLSLKCWAMYTV